MLPLKVDSRKPLEYYDYVNETGICILSDTHVGLHEIGVHTILTAINR